MLIFIDESDDEGPLLDFSKPVPNDILHKVFSNCTADDLHNCKKVRRQWYHVIEDADRRLPQRKIDVKLDDSGIIDVLEVTDIESRKKIRVDIEMVRKEPPFNIFKGCMVPYMADRQYVQHTLRSKLKRMFELGGDKIPVEKFVVTLGMTDFQDDVLRLKEFFRNKHL